MITRRIGTALLAISVLLSGVTATATAATATKTKQSALKWTLDGKTWTPKNAQLSSGTTYAGTELLDKLGMKWNYDAKSSKIAIQDGDKVLILQMGSKVATLNGVEYDIPTSPRSVNKTLLVPVRVVMEMLGVTTDWNQLKYTVSIKRDAYVLGSGKKGPQKVGSVNRMKEILNVTQGGQPIRYAMRGNRLFARTGVMMEGQPQVMASVTSDASVAPMAKMAPSAESAAGATANSNAADNDFSKTNTQVQGVDEADVVKTDGQYIYQVNQQRIMIVKAVPADQMTVVNTMKFTDQSFNPLEMYVDGKHMTIIGTSYIQDKNPIEQPQPVPYTKEVGISAPSDAAVSLPAIDVVSAPAIAIEPAPFVGKMMPYIYNPGRTVTRAIVFDITDRTSPVKVREAELEGDYVSSRKIGESVYLVTNKWLDVYRIMNPDPNLKIADQNIVLTNKDNATVKSVGYDQLYYLPESMESNVMQVAGFRLDQPETALKVQSYLGTGSTIYASMDNLYVATTKTIWNSAPAISSKGSIAVDFIMPTYKTKTNLFKFALDNGSVTFKAQGEADGSLLNQFSMDEYDGNLRIATTTGEVWQGNSANNLVVLDENLKKRGEVAGLAKGEKIYSVRFMGNKGYIVTFKTVDPLFVIDLSNPDQPVVMGELKIPGYSDYLHPYDENHLIGIGKDAVEATWGSETVDPNNSVALNQGMKLAIFDVSDMKNPKELFTTSIGARGTDSAALHNHKAFLFSKEKNLLAFPITVMEFADKNAKRSPFEYGQLAFQGAYVYHIDTKDGFKLKGRISHSDNMEQAKEQGWYNYTDEVERILYIGSNLYTLSKGAIQTNQMESLDKIQHVKLP